MTLKLKTKIKSYQKILEKRLFFQYLVDFNKPSIIALINEKDKKIYIQSAKHPMVAIASLVRELGHKYHGNIKLRKDVRRLQVKILESFETGRELSIEKAKWMYEYLKLGYQLYNKERLPIYTLIKQVDETEDGFDVTVVVKTAGKRLYPVQTFLNHQEADQFISQVNVFDALRMVNEKGN